MKTILITLAVVFSTSAFAQVGIGTANPQATLHIVGDGSPQTGVLFPVVTQLINHPETVVGTVVYYDGEETQGLKNALYIYTSRGWRRIINN